MNDHKLNTENRYDIILPTEIIVKENKNTNVQTKEIDFDKNIVIDQKSTIVLAVTFFLIVFVFLAIVEAFDAVQTKPNCQTPIGETYPAYRLIVSGGSQSRIEMTEVVVPITERTHLREPDDKEYLEIPTEEIETELKKALKDTRFGAMPIAIDRSNLNNILAIFEQHRKIRSNIENEAELQCQQLVNVIVELIKAVQSSPEKQGNGFWRILQGMLGPKTVEEIENNGGIFSDYPKKKI